MEYLKSQTNPDIGLLREAPFAAPHIYWLNNDNSLAAYTFSQLGISSLGSEITQKVQQYGENSNDFIEVVWGESITFPPHVATSVLLMQVGQAEIWQEMHNEGPVFEDWAEYANLGFLGALNTGDQGEHQEAVRIFENTMQLFDNTGFKDKSFNGIYETYKLALALYTAGKINVEYADRVTLQKILLKMQNSNGGFHTHYNSSFAPTGDTNTETTAFALLALSAVVCES